MKLPDTSARVAATALTETQTIQVGDLHLGFTTEFDFTSRLEGAEQATATWRPLARDEYYPLGDLMVQGFDDPNGKKVAMIARDDRWPGKAPALMPPIGFAYIWNSQIFMMIPPEGYVALGGIGCGGDTPDPNFYRCVRRDLMVDALVGNQIYDDGGSGRRDKLSAWAIGAPTAREKHATLAPSTFMPCPYYGAPGPDGFYAFDIGLAETPPVESPPAPVLTSKSPPPETGNSVRYIVQMPWFAVRDPGMSAADQIVKSPIYTIVRTDEYRLAMFKNNNTSVDQSQSYRWFKGISAEQVESFAHTVGIELGMEWSIVKDVFNVSAKLSYEFTYTSENSHGMEQSEETTDMLVAPPYTAAAAYYIESKYEIYRQDGTRIQTMTPTFDIPKSTYNTQFPPRAPTSAAAERRKAVKEPA